MTDTAKASKFQSLDEPTARAFLRESAIGRQQQSLKPDQIETIRQGQQDQSLGADDMVYGLTHADQVWPQVEAQQGKQQT